MSNIVLHPKWYCDRTVNSASEGVKRRYLVEKRSLYVAFF